MSGAGAPDLFVASPGVRVAIIAGSWHEEIMAGLIAGAEEALREAGAGWQTVRVAGSFELPLAAAAALTPGRVPAPGTSSSSPSYDFFGFDAVVCLGVIVRGETPHFDYVSSAVTDGLTRVQLDSGKPVGFGILTTDNDEQAHARSGLPGSKESKGREA